MAEVLACSEELYLTNDSAVLTKVVGLVSVSLPSITIEEVDVTSQDDACVRNTRAGVVDYGSFSATVKHVPNSATDQLLIEHAASKETRAFKIVVGDGSSGTIDVTGNMFISEYNQGDETASGELRTATITGRITAATTQAATV